MTAMDTVLRRAMWPLWILAAALGLADLLWHVPLAGPAALAVYALVALIGAHFGVRLVAQHVRHRRERRAANAAARERMIQRRNEKVA